VLPANRNHVSGDIFEQYAVLTVRDLSRMCTVEVREIVELVDEGILTVAVNDSGEWQFTGEALRRAKLALRLHRDLEVNLAGVALALQLLAEIDALRRAVQRGEGAS
jgi:chaperone modulatory protein CbpM